MDDVCLCVCRAVSIDFNRMRVCGKKNLEVRRLDDGNTMWIWYCHLSRKWRKYGGKVHDGLTFVLCVLNQNVI